MKLVKEHINEKFVADSDPIHDMGIGNTICFYEIRSEMFAGARSEFSKSKILGPWLKYVHSIEGKNITGTFGTSHKVKTIKIKHASSRNYGKQIRITDYDNNEYYIQMKKRYIIR